MFVTYCISIGKYLIFTVIELILTWNWSFLLYFKTLTKCRLLHFDHVVQLGKVSFALAAFTRGIKWIMLQRGTGNGIYYIKQSTKVYIYMWPIYQLHIKYTYIYDSLFIVLKTAGYFLKFQKKRTMVIYNDLHTIRHVWFTQNKGLFCTLKQC